MFFSATKKKKTKKLTALVDAVSPLILESGFHSQNAIGPWPMQEVVPRAVKAAVRIDTMT